MDDRERVGDLDGGRERFVDRVLLARACALGHAVGQAAAVGVVHDEVRATVVELVDQVHPDGAVGVETPEHPRFLGEASRTLSSCAQFSARTLIATCASSRSSCREPHRRERAASEDAFHFVVADALRHPSLPAFRLPLTPRHDPPPLGACTRPATPAG